MKKLAAALILMALSAPALSTPALSTPALSTPAGAAAEGVPMLRSHATVDAENIRLGDLFENAGDKSDIIVAAAPPPGKKTIFEGRWLYAVALANGLNWNPLDTYERAIVERATQTIDHVQLEQAVMAALTPKLNGQRVQVEFSNPNLQLLIPAHLSPSVAVEKLDYDLHSTVFQAVVSVASESPQGSRVQVAGRIYPVTRLPVLRHPAASGDVISEDDVTWTELRSDHLQGDPVTDLDHLIGKAARHGLREGEVLQQIDLRAPVLVNKGAVVLMTVRMPSMTLTAQGQAEDAGARGEIIKVANLHTKTIVEGVVTGPNTVAVQPLNRAVAN